MATELAKAYVEIIPSAVGIGGKISQALGGDGGAEEAGESFGGKLVGKIKGLIAAAGIGAALKEEIDQGAALEQSLGGVETLFKDSADTVIANAQRAYQTAGLSANDYMETVTGFSASLLQSLGGDTERAASAADQALIDMADNANKFGTDMSSIQNAYSGFAKQNYTMLDNLKLGYGGTKTEMERLLADAEKFSGVHYDIDNLADVYEAIHVVQEELGVAGATAAEASTTISGSFASMKAAAENVLGYLVTGMDVGPAISALVESAATFLFDNLVPAIGNILVSLPGALEAFWSTVVPIAIERVGGLITEIASFIGGDGVASILEQVSNIANSAIDFLVTEVPLFLERGVDFIVNLANGVGNAAPEVLTNIGQILQQLITRLMQEAPTMMQKGFELIGRLASGLLSNLPAVISSISSVLLQLLATIAQNLPAMLQKGLEIIGNVAAGLVQAIPNAVSSMISVITGIAGEITKYNWLDLGIGIIDGICKGITNAASRIYNAIKNVLGDAWDAFTDWLKGGKGGNNSAGSMLGAEIAAGMMSGLYGGTGLVSSSIQSGSVILSSSDGYGGGVVVNQFISSRAMTAAELQREARYEMRRGVLSGA